MNSNDLGVPVQSNIHSLDLSEQEWKEWAIANSLPAFLGKQVFRWLYQKEVNDPLKFSDIAAAARIKLAGAFVWNGPDFLTVSEKVRSGDSSQKILFRTRDGYYAECVLMPSENRVTVCVSSQVGCRMACTFCQTGKMGFTRHLSKGEILAQILLCQKILRDENAPRTKVTNVVFMGMGEPLDNFDEVVSACQTMVSENGFGMSKHKVTVSTCGLIPEIKKLGEAVPVSLAISLHAADEALRSSMMPINRKYSLADLKEALLEYPVQTRHGITFEYVMIDGVNDSIAHAKKLVKFVHGLKAKVNLIPMNPHPGSPMKNSAIQKIEVFQKYLSDRSIPAPVRYSRGQDVSAACGQLATKKKNEFDEAPRKVALARRRELMQERSRLAPANLIS
jgi:23S rRNA (adenine2503-C2)-methyltransferase